MLRPDDPRPLRTTATSRTAIWPTTNALACRCFGHLLRPAGAGAALTLVILGGLVTSTLLNLLILPALFLRFGRAKAAA